MSSPLGQSDGRNLRSDSAANPSPGTINQSSAGSNGSAALPPAVSLPKGGGAVRSIGEKFSVNPVTGTAAITIPIAAPAGRGGVGPQLSMSYDSGGGNGPFGFGWGLSLPAISRKTDKGLPKYIDGADSDTFILSGAEDLVPCGSSYRVDGLPYDIRAYRPRVEGLFARIERWTKIDDPAEVHWRSISKDNILTLYGKDAQSRISAPVDPGDPWGSPRTFSWLICETRDDRGNGIIYEYKAEDGTRVDLAKAHERNRGPRDDLRRTANRYIKRIRYGNRTPFLIDGQRPHFMTGEQFAGAGWMFEVVFDYGEHDPGNPTPDDTGQWLVRPDPFSSYRSGFEVRAYRRCKRVLVFHNFPEESQVGHACLVRSTDFGYSDEQTPEDSTSPVYTFLRSVTQVGYRRDGSGYKHKSMPPVEFEYSRADVQSDVLTLDMDSCRGLPEGLDGTRYQWVDLDGEGLSGILTDLGAAWAYKRNLSPLTTAILPDGRQTSRVRFAASEVLATLPSANDLGSGLQFLDLSGDGQIDVVELEDPLPGFFERTKDEDWEPFRPFTSLPRLPWGDPDLKFVDLTGDGLADILITETGLFTFYPSAAEAGFEEAEMVRTPWDEERGPSVVLGDGTRTVFLADMSGDGLSDLVRVRNGEVCYWPNLGYGRFGRKVSMDTAPRFTDEERFDPRRIRLADIDGSGTTDLIYLGEDGVQVCFNQSGNSWAAPQQIGVFPGADNLSNVQVLDLFGNGTSCLVWSSPLPGQSTAPVRYVDLMGNTKPHTGSQKPHLLVKVSNNLGAETRIDYAPSTQFYLADKYNGQPWITRLPFPVHVVQRVETYDWISRNRFATRYAYHHGYFDGPEREFRGFGMVEQWDTEEFATLAAMGELPDPTNIDGSSHVPPVLTKTWFHTGAYLEGGPISRQFEGEYYKEPDLSEQVPGLTPEQMSAMLLEDTILPSDLSPALTPGEAREACRSLKGSILRQEIWGLDAKEEADRPYSVSERNYTIHRLQPRGANKHAVFFTHARETIDFYYERKLYKVLGDQLVDPQTPGAKDAADPRVAHRVNLTVDPYGNILESASIAYGRRFKDPSLTPADQDKQCRTLITYTLNGYTNPVSEANSYRTPLLAETRTYELVNAKPSSTQPGVTSLFRFEDLYGENPPGVVQQACDGKHDLSYEDVDGSGATEDHTYRRLIEHVRTLYRRDDLSAPLPLAPIPALDQPTSLESLGLTYESYKLAFTAGLLHQIFIAPGKSTAVELSGILENEGRYVSGSSLKAAGLFPATDDDGCWWIPSGHVLYSPNTADTPAQELAYARQHFFLSHRYRNPFHTDAVSTESFVTYDRYDLLVQETRDALGNRTTVGERDPDDPTRPLVRGGQDYCVLQPALVMDPNRNRSAVVFDTLGLIVGTAVMGKPEDSPRLGDVLDGFDPDLPDDLIASHLQNPLADPHTILGRATTRLVYDLFAYQRTKGQTDPQPIVVYTLARETHDADLGQGEQTKVQHSFSYSDGFGREIQKKIQAEPENINGVPGLPRWVGTGWTIFNNKGKPVRQYEPFFSQLGQDGYRFEFGVQIGVSPILFYDPLERVVATLHPNHTYEKVVFDPWRQITWDANDTVRSDPSADEDVRGFFLHADGTPRLPAGDYRPTWYELRTDPQYAADAAKRWPDPRLRAAEASAANKAADHASTPISAHLDTLGRTFLTIADNGPDPAQPNQHRLFPTRVMLDIEGNQRAVRDAVVQNNDALGRLAMVYGYDMLGNKTHQASMEAGSRWMLNDVAGKPLRIWDSRGHMFRTEYDALRRPMREFVKGADPANQDRETLFQMTEYGEGQADDSQLNLRTRVFRQYDSAGIVTNKGVNPTRKKNESYDFKGNLLRSTRQLTSDYKSTPDWSGTPALEPEVFVTSTIFDALNRPIQIVAPHVSATPDVIQPTYNEANLLEKLDVWLQYSGGLDALLPPATADLPAIINVDYNAKGQRLLIEYGNGARTRYTNDPETSRLTDLFTGRGSAFPDDCPDPSQLPCGVQNLHYTYDPVGNIAYTRDDAQQTIYFRNNRVDPSADYTYDAIYRLTRATGREHLGQTSGQMNPPRPLDAYDSLRIRLDHPNDGNAMGSYVQHYRYDEVGNIAEMKHEGSDPANPGWTRTYVYDEPSLLDSGASGTSRKTSNRLTRTIIGSITEPYSYDTHGNVVGMPHLTLMAWDFKDQLSSTSCQTVNENPPPDKVPETTFYIYDAAGQRIRKVIERQNGTRKEERIYLGGVELYRKYNGNGQTIKLERETLHAMDGTQRVAIVETRTQGGDQTPARLTRYQYINHLGSTILELDAQAHVISYEEYYPYGSTSYQAVDSHIEVPKRYRYTGKERDEENGMYYQGARYYAPWLGRWTAVDPLGMSSHLSSYCYSRGNPIYYYDPSGLYEEPVHGAVTYHLALAAGFTEADAAHLALATAAVDHDPATQPVSWQNIKTGVTAKYHFPNFSTALGDVEEQIQKGPGMDVNQLGRALHALEDVGFSDAPGPHMRSTSEPRELEIFPGWTVTFNLAEGISYSETVVPRIAVSQPDPLGAVGRFLRRVAQEQKGWKLAEPDSVHQNIGIGHPFYITESGAFSNPKSHVADQAFQDPRANTEELSRVYGVLKEAAVAKYGGNVSSNDESARSTISAITTADTKAKVDEYLNRSVGFDGRAVASYSSWVERNWAERGNNPMTPVQWPASAIDSSIKALPRYIRSIDGVTYDTKTGRTWIKPMP